MLETDEGIKKLYEIHEKYPLKRKSAYNVMDYINSMDYVVRSMEIALGLQHGGRHHLSLNLNDRFDNSGTVSPSNKNPLEELQESQNQVEVEVEEISNKSDDVFANNPSNLMMAKVKVNKPKSEAPKPETWCWNWTNWKCFPRKQQPPEYDSHMHFSKNGNLIPHQTLLSSNDYGIKDKITDTSLSISKYQLKQINSSTLDKTPFKGHRRKINFDSNQFKIKETSMHNGTRQHWIDLRDRRESEHSSKESFIINKSCKNDKLFSNTSIRSKPNSSIDVIDK